MFCVSFFMIFQIYFLFKFTWGSELIVKAQTQCVKQVIVSEKKCRHVFVHYAHDPGCTHIWWLYALNLWSMEGMSRWMDKHKTWMWFCIFFSCTRILMKDETLFLDKAFHPFRSVQAYVTTNKQVCIKKICIATFFRNIDCHIHRHAQIYEKVYTRLQFSLLCTCLITVFMILETSVVMYKSV